MPPGSSELQVVCPASAPPGLRLAVVIPAYNEQDRLPSTLNTLVAYRTRVDPDWELILVDDGSHDGTRSIMDEFAREHSWARVVFYNQGGEPANRGKGFAVRQGVLASTARLVMFSDADLSTPIDELSRLAEVVESGEAELAIASRALPESDLAVHQPWYREMMGRTFNLLVQILAVPGIHDTQCGFKLFEGDAARRLFRVARINGFGFDPEILFLARRAGYRIREVPVTWRHVEASRVSPLRAPLQMVRELLTIRLLQWRGCYRAL